MEEPTELERFHIQELLRLRKLNMSYRLIAKELNVGLHYINNLRQRFKVQCTNVKNKHKAYLLRITEDEVRHTFDTWLTNERLDRIKQLRDSKWSFVRIAGELCVSETIIRRAANLIGLK